MEILPESEKTRVEHLTGDRGLNNFYALCCCSFLREKKKKKNNESVKFVYLQRKKIHILCRRMLDCSIEGVACLKAFYIENGGGIKS